MGISWQAMMGFNFVFDSFDVIGSRDGEVEAVVLDAIYDSGSPNNLQTNCYSSCAKHVTNEQLQGFGASLSGATTTAAFCVSIRYMDRASKT